MWKLQQCKTKKLATLFEWSLNFTVKLMCKMKNGMARVQIFLAKIFKNVGASWFSRYHF